jgi:hypothetical protein
MSKYKTTWHDIAKAILRKEEFINEEQLIEQDKQDIQEFSRSQLDALARQYSDLKGKTISIDNANKLRKIFDKIPNHFLNDLRKKHIPFLSGLALSRMVQKGIPVREDREIAEGFEWHTLSFLKRKGFNVARFSYGKLLVPKSDVEDVKKLLKKETEKVNGDVTVMPNAIIGEAKEEVLDEGLQLSKLVGKSIAHLEMYVELANDIKKEYFKTNSQVSMFIKAKADQVLRSVPSLVKDLRKPGIWSEQVELVEDMAVRIKNIKMPPNTGGEVPNSIIFNVPAGKDPKEVGRGILKRMTGKVPTSFDVVKEDASDMVQAKAAGTQKRIADLTTNINDKEDRARNINPGDKNKVAIHKADINHMKLKLSDLKDKLRTDRHKRAMAAQNEPETDTSGKPNKKKEITENE